MIGLNNYADKHNVMVHNLIDRQSEWKFLEDAFEEKKAQLIVVYGRRRVGKSFLTSKFINEKKGMYYLCSKGNEKEQLELLSNKCSDYFNDPILRSRPFTKWHDFFTWISEKARERRVIIEFDEFPFLIAANTAIPSLFQKYWDEILSSSNVYLILCGSSISMMETEVLRYRSPLYGRRTGQWKLKPLRFKHVVEFFDKKIPLQYIIEIYAITGGMPFYLVNLNRTIPAIENALEYIAKKGRPLLEEGEALIKEELPDAMTYFSILHAVAQGQTKQSDIANHIGKPATALTRYLTNLQRLGFIEKRTPITEKEKSKKSLYFIMDNFLNFWFTFIYSNKSYIEEENYAKIEAVLKKEFTQYTSHIFESVCMQAMEELRKENKIDFDVIGAWWAAYRSEENERKTEELDIVALKNSKDIFFGECKWKEEVAAESILNQLKEKVKRVNWHNESRKEYYLIFAKNFKEKKKLGENVFLFDINDLQKIFRANQG